MKIFLIISICVVFWLISVFISVFMFALANWLFVELPVGWHIYHSTLKDCMAESFGNGYLEETSFTLSALFGPWMIPVSIIYFIVLFLEFLGDKISELF